jgi:predicted dehydrogenase
MEKVRVGIIGIGIGRIHLDAYKKNPKVEVLALCDLREEETKKLAEQYRVKYVFTDYKKMLEMEEIDAVSVCTPNYLHMPMTVAALEAGKHVLCEKPPARNAGEVEKMKEAVERAGKKYMTALVQRFSAEGRYLKKLAEEGFFGEIYSAICLWQRRKGIPGMGGWFTQKEKAGGGPVIDIGVHILDLVLYIMGYPKAVSVSAETYAKFGPYGEGAGGWGIPEAGGKFDVEDLANALIRLENGATILAQVSWASHIESDRLGASLQGTKAGAEWGPLRLFTDIAGQPVDIIPHLPPTDAFAGEINHFIECILEDKEPIPNIEQAIAIQKILDAVYKSAEIHKEVEV